MDFSLKRETNWVCATHREATSGRQLLINEYFSDFRAKDKCNEECFRIWRKHMKSFIFLTFSISTFFFFFLVYFPEILACW